MVRSSRPISRGLPGQLAHLLALGVEGVAGLEERHPEAPAAGHGHDDPRLPDPARLPGGHDGRVTWPPRSRSTNASRRPWRRGRARRARSWLEGVRRHRPYRRSPAAASGSYPFASAMGRRPRSGPDVASPSSRFRRASLSGFDTVRTATILPSLISRISAASTRAPVEEHQGGLPVQGDLPGHAAHLLGHVEQEAGGPLRPDHGAQGGAHLATPIGPHHHVIGQQPQEPVEVAAAAGGQELPGQLLAVPGVGVEALATLVDVAPGPRRPAGGSWWRSGPPTGPPRRRGTRRRRAARTRPVRAA